ncbi:MAG: outer membrane protein assembly factor BamD [Pseudomonadota bacterium]
MLHRPIATESLPGAPSAAAARVRHGHLRRGTGRIALVLLTALSIQGCMLWPFGKDEERLEDPADGAAVDATEQMLYRNTQRSLRSGNYDTAIQGLEMLEARFPFGRYAEQAQLELIYARYMAFDHAAARIAADRFIRLHPQHPDVDYAYYLKGLAAFNRNTSMMDRLFATDASKRDITSARESYADFGQLLARYPNSTYAPDARQRMIYLRNMLARAELHVADYYLRRGAYVAAHNRARYVIENYGKSDAIADALALTVEANVKMGLETEANNALRVLALNFPQYPAFDDAGDLVLADAIKNRDRSWINLMTLGILDRPRIPPPIRIVNPQIEAAAASSGASG